MSNTTILESTITCLSNRVTKARFFPGVFRNERAILEAAVGKSIQSARSEIIFFQRRICDELGKNCIINISFFVAARYL